MDQTVSVSKGVFLYKNDWKKPVMNKKKKNITVESPETLYAGEIWYETFTKEWRHIDKKIKDLTKSTYNTILRNLVNYVKECHSTEESEFEDAIPAATLLTGINQPDHVDLTKSTYNTILRNLVNYVKECHSTEESEFEDAIPAATLLTGINQPDHVVQFNTLCDKIRCEVTPHVAMVSSQDAPTLKSLIEHVVSSFLWEDNTETADESPARGSSKRIRNCNISTLSQWYKSKYKQKDNKDVKSLVIIIQDFESFSNDVLQDFISILSSHKSDLPIVLVFGVATSASVLHKCLPYHISSKLLIKVFQSRSSAEHLNQIVEEVLLTPECPFHLSGKVFQLLIDVFLFYDFSVTGFIQSFKYCMMEHYYENNARALCCNIQRIPHKLKKMTSKNLESIKKLHSFRAYVESQDCRKRISLLEDDDYFRKDLELCLISFHEYLQGFHVMMKIFHIFTQDLPKKTFGLQIRELYTHCCSSHVTKSNGFNEFLQLISFQSKENLIESITHSLKILNLYSKEPLQLSPPPNSPNGDKNMFTVIRVQFALFVRQLQNASLECKVISDGEGSHFDSTMDGENVPIKSRMALKQSLYRAAKLEKVQSEFELVRSRLKHYLSDIFEKHLQPLTTKPFNEIFVFEDLGRVKRHIIGAPRGAIHSALNNPAAYLQCACCEISSSLDMRPTFPDVCIAYKLHAECGRHINLYDWLQAFVAVLQPEHCDENRVISPELQVRFTRAVSELQFLGFIKASTRKTDHVIRLTW